MKPVEIDLRRGEVEVEENDGGNESNYDIL
jgi:hypothetical protein